MRGLLVSLLSTALLLGGASAHAQTRNKGPARPAAKGPARKPAGKGKGAPGNGQPSEAARRAVTGGAAGGASAEAAQAESAELKAAREAERELFPQSAPSTPSPVLGASAALAPPGPEVSSSGLPPSSGASTAPASEAADPKKIPWMQGLKMPDMPVRWDERVVRYLQFFHDDPRGRGMAALGWRRVGRYRDVIRAALRAEKVPESLIWVSMVESGFEPKTKSPVGAMGLWQFMPEVGRIYGLRVDRWMDERQDPVKSSQAGARYLADLHRRFGGWELALAAYNMGYGGLLSAIRKYNTNDFWELSRFEAGIPWETTLYVPKIIALAIVAENPQVFGLEATAPEGALTFDTIKAPPSLSLEAIARASGSTAGELGALNPHLLARRTPPAPLSDYEVRVPAGKGGEASRRLSDEVGREPKLSLATVRFGQTIASLATELGVSRSSLAELNGLAYDENPQPGESILVPAALRPAPSSTERPVVVAPRSPAAIAGKQRVFYRVIGGDSLAAVAAAFRVQADDLRSWNHLDPTARLQEATTLQVFIQPGQDLSGVVAVREEDARVLVVGSDEFFAWFEAQKGRRRVSVTVGQGETWKTIAGKYGLSLGLLERINRRSHSEPLRPGETIIVYTKKAGDPAHAADEAT